MKSFLLFVCSFLLVITFASGAPAQSQKRDKPSQTAAPSAADGQQIDVKPDRFSGATKITLKPIYLFKKSNQKLAMSLEIKVDPKKSDDDIAFVNFISYSEYPMNFGDRELHCLIDGKPTSFGVAERGDLALFPGSAETLFIGIGLNELDQMAKGKKVEMRLGSIEWTCSDDVLSALDKFVSAAKQARTSK